MSSNTENRSRNSTSSPRVPPFSFHPPKSINSQSQPSQAPQRAQSNNQSPAPSPAPPSNAWTDRETSRGSSGGKPNKNSMPAATGKAQAPGPSFNGSETREFLKRMYQDALAGDLEKKALWKPAGEGAGKRASGPWATKPNIMANGQDFWVQLTKQVGAREQGGGG